MYKNCFKVKLKILMVFISHFFLICALAYFLLGFFWRQVTPAQPFKHNKSGYVNLQFTVNNKKQVFTVLNDWLQTSRRTAKNTPCITSHNRILHSGSSVACVKHGKLWKNFVFLFPVSTSPLSHLSPTLIQATLLLQWWGPKPQSGLLDNGYSGPLAPEKPEELLVFGDRLRAP